VRFNVTVSPAGTGTGTPTGSVLVMAGTKTLCSIHLSGGKGSCSPAASALGPHGRFAIGAHYAGDTMFRASSSTLKVLTVVSNSSTSLSLSTSTVKYGRENAVKFTFTVTGPRGVPTGNAMVGLLSNGKILCSHSLSHGKGSCSPSARALSPGTHPIVAHYNGNAAFNPSTSSKKMLTVKR